MADLSVTYSKTPKGLRARAALIGGLSAKLMKVLSLIDGSSRAETILTKFDDISADKLLGAITKLEVEGYIRPTTQNFYDDDKLSFDTAPDFSSTIAEKEDRLFDDEEEDSLFGDEESAPQQPADAIAVLALERQKKLAERQALVNETEKAKELDKAQQQQALIKAIEKAKAQTKVQEKIDIEQAVAASEKNLKLEALTKIKAEQLKVARAQAEQSLMIAEAQSFAAAEAEKQARIQLAVQIELEKAEKAKLAAQAEQAERARQEKLRLIEARKAEKEAQLTQKIAFVETVQLRLMAEFEEKAKQEAAAQAAKHAEMVAAAKLILKTKAEARAKAQAEALALKNAPQKIYKS